MGGVEGLALDSEDAAAEGVDGLLEDGDLRGLAGDLGIAKGDNFQQLLSFFVVHLRAKVEASNVPFCWIDRFC